MDSELWFIIRFTFYSIVFLGLCLADFLILTKKESDLKGLINAYEMWVAIFIGISIPFIIFLFFLLLSMMINNPI